MWNISESESADAASLPTYRSTRTLYGRKGDRGCLLDTLSRTVKAQKRIFLKKASAYRKIQPIMSVERDGLCDLSEVILYESSDLDMQCESKLNKKPKRVLQFSDGVMEEYSSEDEVDMPKADCKTITQIDTKNMKWLPWAWHHTTLVSSKVLDGCDYVGEFLANFFGITAPKYQFEINEFYRQQALEKEICQKQDLEMGGWSKQNRNNLINNDKATTVEQYN